MSARVVPVSALLTRLKNVIAQSVPLDGVWIQGEISNLTKHRSGHYYFSIKDSRSEMSCVMFASYVNRLRFSVEEGMQVLVNGSVSIYEQRGSLQLYVKASCILNLNNENGVSNSKAISARKPKSRSRPGSKTSGS